ncbi:hypothetical protein FA13DRAFT_1796445 [Coprinellus micaceus]|uniref:RING-type domain-containing protein n=1 Tax=Coprinellus micaceus TaxID=71717 RepID=A0A4Y7STY7_COPMI|nr:hypothetical protein FA13DRAFT_1796445 [Coprinellus micaceus]
MATPLDHDIESAMLIAQLQHVFELEVSRGRKGKARALAPRSDEEVAFQMQAEELGSWKQVYQDYTLTKSMSDALDLDTALLEAYRVMEEAAEADRCVAELVSSGRLVPRPTEAQSRLESRDFDLERASRTWHDTKALSKGPSRNPTPLQLGEEEPLDSIWRFDDLSESLPKAGPSGECYKRVNCIGCDARLRPADAIITACNHRWCTECLQNLVEVYIRDETLHPLRCCKNPFSESSVSTHLASRGRLLEQYNAKRHEYEVPPRTVSIALAPLVQTS